MSESEKELVKEFGRAAGTLNTTLAAEVAHATGRLMEANLECRRGFLSYEEWSRCYLRLQEVRDEYLKELIRLDRPEAAHALWEMVQKVLQANHVMGGDVPTAFPVNVEGLSDDDAQKWRCLVRDAYTKLEELRRYELTQLEALDRGLRALAQMRSADLAKKMGDLEYEFTLDVKAFNDILEFIGVVEP